MKRVLIILAMCLLCTSLTPGQEGDILDLTLPRAVKHDRNGMNGGVLRGRPGAVSSDKLEDSPIKVTLDQVNQESCRIEDELIYEVTLENISKEDFAVPISRDQGPNDEDEIAAQAQLSGNHMAFLKATLGLFVEDEAFRTEGVQWLYGVKFLPESVRILRPGQKLRIRSSGKIVFADHDSYKRVVAEMPKRCAIRARLRLLHLNGRISIFMEQYEPAVSTNSVTIEVRKYEPPDQSPSQ